ncbi:MAG: hypothetical protein KAR31_01850, partial [Candidatus Omnitrophica bacterium]|nr:hypothetical protein [Candidatus Omnitrophota bacterium]
GTLPDEESSGVTVNSITRAFNNLNNAVSTGATPSSDDLLGTTDLVTGNYILNIPCYADGTDSVAVSIDSWTTGANNYIKIYTPVSPSEVGVSQRHAGKWNTEKYRLEPVSGYVLAIKDDYVRLEGLQIAGVSGETTIGIPWDSVGTTDIRISHNIMKGNGFEDVGTYGILSDDNSATVTIWNNIIYDFDGWNPGIWLNNGTNYVYSNTIVDCRRGIRGEGDTVIAKNNICIGNTTTDYSGTFDISSNNISSDVTSPDGAAYRNQVTTVDADSANTGAILYVADTAGFAADDNVVIDPDASGGGKEICTILSVQDAISLTMTANLTYTHLETDADKVSAIIFVDEANDDFHLASNDTGAKDLGTDLTSDANLAFSDDIDGDTRPVAPGTWDIGADETDPDTTVPTIDDATLYDTDNDGYIDEIWVDFSEAMDDASVTANDDAGRFTFGGTAATGVDSITVSGSGNTIAGDDPGSANDANITIWTDDTSVFGTGISAVEFTAATDKYEDLWANDTATTTTITEIDLAKPVLVDVFMADAGGTAGIFNEAGDRMDLVFSETLSALPTEAQLEAALTFAGGATDGDNIPDNI